MKIYIHQTITQSRKFITQQLYTKINSMYYYFYRPKIKLGRWSLLYHPKDIEQRVKRENEDHSF